jgi:ribose/xylose/arabinose/galactoside ABC-type transport system permease subunit
VLLTVLSNVFDLTQFDPFYQQLLEGAIILVAVATIKSSKA